MYLLQLFQTSLKSNQRGVPLHGTNASTLIDFNSRLKFTSTPARPSGDANAFLPRLVEDKAGWVIKNPFPSPKGWDFLDDGYC